MLSKGFLLASWLAFSAFVGSTYAKGQNWVVIVAMAHGYSDYAGQSNTCHAYHTMRNGGIPASNIIHFNYDDVATDSANPVQNNLVNIAEGLNVYPGCEIDYRKDDVTPDVFVSVMTGNKKAVNELTGRDGNVLESGPDDSVFLTLDGHGGSGSVCFPGGRMYAEQLMDMLRTMHAKKMYKNMVIYLESCYSGSMFEGVLPDDMNIYAVTASNSNECAFKSCYDERRHAFVGSVFYNAFTYTVDAANRTTMTLKQLYEQTKIASLLVKEPSRPAHPQEYGDLSMNQLVLSEFMGSVENNGKSHRSMNTLRFERENKDPEFPAFLRNPPMDMAEIAVLMRRLMSKDLTHQQRRELQQKLDFSLKVKKLSEEIFRDIAELAAQERPSLSREFFLDNREPVENYLCYDEALNLLTSRCPVMEPTRFPFILRNCHILTNMCNKLSTDYIANVINKAIFVREECELEL